MELSVKLNGKSEPVTVVCATEPDFGFIEQWKSVLGTNPHPHRRDSVDFAELTKYRFTAHSPKQPYAGSMDEFQEHITDNPHTEIACLVYLKCDWFPGCDTIGLSHFRRTWSNRIVLDYLCAHPFVTKPERNSTHEVKGVGGVLLYFVAQVAKKYKCDLIWGEATQNSCGFYQHVLKLDDVQDLIHVPQEKYLAYCDKMESAWADPQPSAVLEELYKAEQEHPPFVGSKTTVHSASHILVIHFLELPLNKKREVAVAVGYTPPNSLEISDAELFRQILQHAKENNKMVALWHEVELRHPMGASDSNPYTEK